MNILIVSVGSYGDHYPLLGIGLALKDKGHKVTMLANDYFASATRHSGLDFHSIGNLADYNAMLENADSVGNVCDTMLRPMRNIYEHLQSHYIPGHTVAVCNIAASLGVRLAHEQGGIPMITINHIPMIFGSAYDPPALLSYEYPAWWPRWIHRGGMGVVRFIYDLFLMRHLQAYRRELGLPSQPRGVLQWMLSPQKIIGLFPDWFARPQPDWPANTELTGFHLFDEGALAERALPADLQDFLAHGTPPIIFTPGTPNFKFAPFFEKAAQATTAIGARAIFITKFKEQVPTNLPPHIRFYDYLPFSQIFGLASVLVHHGGIGTMAQAMRAGRPQLITPWGLDQYDNAARLKTLGIGDVINSKTCTAETLAAKLQHLMQTPEIHSRCQTIAKLINAASPLENASRIIEGLIRPNRGETTVWELFTRRPTQTLSIQGPT